MLSIVLEISVSVRERLKYYLLKRNAIYKYCFANKGTVDIWIIARSALENAERKRDYFRQVYEFLYRKNARESEGVPLWKTFERCNDHGSMQDIRERWGMVAEPQREESLVVKDVFLCEGAAVASTVEDRVPIETATEKHSDDRGSMRDIRERWGMVAEPQHEESLIVKDMFLCEEDVASTVEDGVPAEAVIKKRKREEEKEKESKKLKFETEDELYLERLGTLSKLLRRHVKLMFKSGLSYENVKNLSNGMRDCNSVINEIFLAKYYNEQSF